jgi:DNA-binding MarR family transcriptional regulator
MIAAIYELAGALRRNGETVARRLGQTQARWQVLSAASGGDKTVPQLARRLGVSRQAVQRIADALVADQLARFADNPDHRTSPHLVPTEGGQRKLAEITHAAREFHEALARRLKGLDLAALRRGLGRVQQTLDALEPFDEEEKDHD